MHLHAKPGKLNESAHSLDTGASSYNRCISAHPALSERLALRIWSSTSRSSAQQSAHREVSTSARCCKAQAEHNRSLNVCTAQNWESRYIKVVGIEWDLVRRSCCKVRLKKGRLLEGAIFPITDASARAVHAGKWSGPSGWS